MTQQKYRVTCECGKAFRVTSGEAGSSLPCVCGKTVVVPALSKLRESVVASADTPEVEFDARLRTGQLPIERKCVLCQSETEQVTMISMRCKQRQELAVMPLLLGLLYLVPCVGWIAALLGAAVAVKTIRERGTVEDAVIDFPVRVCPKCTPRLAGGGVARSAVKSTELYANLLAKYSHAKVMKVR